ncbi:conserved hypothetical protein [Burkholderia sp. H160]|nr:conserved hypothetical protein [Burkholderia sp. H160]
MTRYHLLALTNCVPGQESEFERWYDEQHLSDALNVPGVISAQRFRTVDGLQAPLSWRFLTLYELETSDPAALLQELGQRIGTPLMPLTDAMDVSNAGAAVLESAGRLFHRADSAGT